MTGFGRMRGNVLAGGGSIPQAEEMATAAAQTPERPGQRSCGARA